MSVSIDVVPIDSNLCMYGDPDPSSAYSLSGHVNISLSSSFLRKQSRVLLRSLELTFEGQSEVVAPSVGYSSLRLCQVTTELVPNEPVLLSNEGTDEYSSEPCHWNLVFNLAIPGWLPESTSFGQDDLGVSYRLYATAKYVDIENHKRDSSSSLSASSSSWSFSSLCSAFCSRERVAEADTHISVRRFAQVPSDEPKDARLTTYLINHPKVSDAKTVLGGIPPEILSTIQILTSVPEYINVDDDCVNLTLRLRTKGLSTEECKRLQLTGFSVNVLQKDKCRSRPSRDFKARYPLPGEDQQPPSLPLRKPSRSTYLYDPYYYPSSDPDAAFSRTFSLLPQGESGVYNLQNDNYIFANDAEPVDRPTWYTLQTNIPIMHCAEQAEECDWAGTPLLRPTNRGPLLTVRHEIIVSLPLMYDVPGTTTKAKQVFTFSVPIKFVSVAPPLPRRSLSPPPPVSPASSSTSDLSSTCASVATPDVSTGIVSAMLPPPILPPYSQLFYSNGDRKIDPTPLPLYTPREDNSSGATSSASSSSGSLVCGVSSSVDDSGTMRGEQALATSMPVSVPQTSMMDQKYCSVA